MAILIGTTAVIRGKEAEEFEEIVRNVAFLKEKQGELLRHLFLL
jgi:hypothetical protein